MDKFEGITNLSPSIQTAAKTVYTAFEILKEEVVNYQAKMLLKEFHKKLY
jgi:hypothetical protein